MSLFLDNFWGEKNNGFDVLYQNMKHGLRNTTDLADFLRESCAIEETYCKLLTKLAKQTSNYSSLGTFGPVWLVLKTLAEKLASLHLQLVHKWQDLIKDVQKYIDEQAKKQKTIKDNESATLECVHSIQHITAAVQKAKEIYHARALEYEKLKRDNAQPNQVEKAEVKYKKANDEYRSLLEKYENVRNDFHQRMTDACIHFQEVEEAHLQQLKDFIDAYIHAYHEQQQLIGDVHNEMSRGVSELTVDKLIDQFIANKTTGTERPGPIAFEEVNLSNLPAPTEPTTTAGEPTLTKKDRRDSIGNMLDNVKNKREDFPSPKPSPRQAIRLSQMNTLSPNYDHSWNKLPPMERSPLRSSRWFLKGKRKREKKKEKRKKDKDEGSESPEPTPEPQPPAVDEEGFSIRPENPLGEKDSCSSSSSDSEEESDRNRRLIKIEIKPLETTDTQSNGGTIEDIRASIGNLKLSPTPKRRTPIDPKFDPNMKRSVSVSDTISAVAKSGAPASQDLLGMEDYFLGASSSASTPTGGNYAFPGGAPMSGSASIPSNLSQHVHSDASTPSGVPPSLDVLNENGPSTDEDIPPALPAKQRHHSITSSNSNLSVNVTLNSSSSSAGSSVIPPKPAPRKIPPPQPVRGRQSPSPSLSQQTMSRADSTASLNSVTFSTTGMPVGSSRGPSPLTLGMCDTIPIAVAFTETVNAYFKGNDKTKCIVRLSGGLMISFPAGIVRYLTDHLQPPQLSFRVKNTHKLESVHLNTQLVTEDSYQSTADSSVYVFDSLSLMEHLKRQQEQNKSASYFNIDIVKYNVKSSVGADDVPLLLTSYWKCEPGQTDFRLDYQYNTQAFDMPMPLSNVNVIVPVNGSAQRMHSLPTGVWSPDTNRAHWKLPNISPLDESQHDCLRARFELAQGPSTPATVAVQFVAEGASVSGLDFELVGPGYRVSLLKKRVSSGKYLSDTDTEIRYV